MSEKKTSLLPRIELLILGVFFISFILYATSKCSATKKQYATEESAETARQDSSDTQATASAADSAVVAEAPAPAQTTTRYTPLYVTIDGLNVRAEPKLNGKIVDRLPLYEEVAFMNETTEFTQEISLGKIVRNDPWIKIRTRKGRTGWVFGAGVHYYKIKLEGVE